MLRHAPWRLPGKASARGRAWLHRPRCLRTRLAICRLSSMRTRLRGDGALAFLIGRGRRMLPLHCWVRAACPWLPEVPGMVLRGP